LENGNKGITFNVRKKRV